MSYEEIAIKIDELHRLQKQNNATQFIAILDELVADMNKKIKEMQSNVKSKTSIQG